MIFDSSIFWIIAGLMLVGFGGAIVFSKRFFNWFSEYWWNRDKFGNGNWSPNGVWIFNKVKGLGALAVGITFLVIYFTNT
jgi:hypothetical protein